MQKTIYDLLRELTELATDERNKGTLFENLIANWLVTDPLYADRIDHVWRWEEWPDRWGSDDGIDLVARERSTGDYWAIQCKFYAPETRLDDISNFLAVSGKTFATREGPRTFVQRIVVSTTERWSSKAEKALENQTVPVSRIFPKHLAESPIDWAAFSLKDPKAIRLKAKKEAREHQVEAISAVSRTFAGHARAKLIMACGTGKTFTALKLVEQQVPTGGRILFLAPSIALVAQTLREWTAEAAEPLHAFVVCSDTKVGKDSEDLAIADLAYPATTDPVRLERQVAAVSTERRTVIFATYQSIEVVIAAQAAGMGAFDIVIADEAHRTTGVTLAGDNDSVFQRVHDDSALIATHRLYMTATPRIYADASLKKAKEASAALYSMDDVATFGPEAYRLGFGAAVDRDLLAEYKVLIVAVDEERMGGLSNIFNSTYRVGDGKAVDATFATKVIGAWKGLSKTGLVELDTDGTSEALPASEPMKRAVAFARSIEASKTLTALFGDLVSAYQSEHGADDERRLVGCSLQHVDGTMNALQRLHALDWLKADPGTGQCRILTNARCLSEGVDVPSLDAAVFFDARDSVIDIVQSVGRVMRKAPGKTYGYIILPVGIPRERLANYNSYIESDERFRGIWKVLKALRAHDERLVDEAEFRRRVKVIGGDEGGGGGEGGGDQGELTLPPVPIDAIGDAVYAAIPKKLGDREYWAEWAKSIGDIAGRIIGRIQSLLKDDPKARKAFETFVESLRHTLNPEVSDDDAIEMLAQHIITLPVFQALFAESGFPDRNAVGQALQAMVDKLDAAAIGSETEGLARFYDNVRERVRLARSDASKQEVIRNLYDTFFHNAFPRMADRLGIVYTPVEVVDFILRSADVALRRHFKSSLSEKGVQILDPFCGTGTFPVRLLQSGLITPADLARKYGSELHANEIVLLAYYIASVNIETAYHSVAGEPKAFDGMVLTDTFQLSESDQLLDTVLPRNSARAKKQKAQPIRVIVGNPPYSAQQDSENDNNKNLAYPGLDARIRETYAARSNAKLLKNLYDSYVRAIRWASDRIGERGVVAFVTNGSFLDANNMDGLRQCLAAEYSHLYVFNLRGNQRTSGEESRREGGKIFGSGSRTPVAITILVKDPAHAGPCEINYRDIGDYLSREEKLAIVQETGSIANGEWERLMPNASGDWINHRDPAFGQFMQLGSKGGGGSDALFSIYSLGVITNRDAWAYNMSLEDLQSNIARMLTAYGSACKQYAKAVDGLPKDQWPEVQSVVDPSSKLISWTRSLKAACGRNTSIQFEQEAERVSTYRPFVKQWLYFSRRLNEMVYQVPRLFPTPRHANVVISATGIGASRSFSAVVTDAIPNMHLHDTGQCFPLYWYEKRDDAAETQSAMFQGGETPDAEGYVRRDGISDWALGQFRERYADAAITKEDLFWYVYGILHSPEYKARFGSDLKKMLPRIPFAADFWAFSRAGRTLGHLHLNYETVEPWPLQEVQVSTVPDYRVTQMRFAGKRGSHDKTVIQYNEHLHLTGIPAEAYEYIVNGKSALEWVMEQYAYSTDKASGIVNDPNHWCTDQNNPRYLVDLIKRLVRVSVETVAIVRGLPALGEDGGA